MSPEYLPRYVGEFEGRHNNRDLDTIAQMREVVRGGEGKRLKYAELIRHPHGCEAIATLVPDFSPLSRASDDQS